MIKWELCINLKINRYLSTLLIVVYTTGKHIPRFLKFSPCIIPISTKQTTIMPNSHLEPNTRS